MKRLTCFLDFFVRSIPHETIFSNTASTVENAANDIKIKKKLPHSLPSGILLKILGKVINMSEGPEVWSTPYVNVAGKIISPETIATKVSSITIVTDSPSILLSLLI